MPLRAVMEQYGCDVTWNAASNSAVLVKDGTMVVVPIGENYILVNGKKVTTDTAAQIKDGLTYLPIRAVLESFGAAVEWKNGTVTVKSDAASGAGFENVYVDEKGNLIFEQANGTKLNLGSVKGQDGAPGMPGVSVTDVKIDANGDLIVTLSSGKTINAGSVRANSGSAVSGLTFADYPVGTKFYLTQPTGAFDVKLKVDGTMHNVHFDSVYYELTSKYGFNDAAAWTYEEGVTRFAPYGVTLRISGKTAAALAGNTLRVSLLSDNKTRSYGDEVGADGSFAMEAGYTTWDEPETLRFESVSVKVSSGDLTPTPPVEDTEPDVGEPEDEMDKEFYERIVPLIVGTWSGATGLFELEEDGSVKIGSETYSPVTLNRDAHSVEVVFRNKNQAEFEIQFVQHWDSGEYYHAIVWAENDVLSIGDFWRGHYLNIDLSSENFLDFFEFVGHENWNNDPFGDATKLTYEILLEFKEEFALVEESNRTIAIDLTYQLGHYFCEYNLEEKSYAVGERVVVDDFNSDYSQQAQALLMSENNLLKEYVIGNRCLVARNDSSFNTLIENGTILAPEGCSMAIPRIDIDTVVINRLDGAIELMLTDEQWEWYNQKYNTK